MIRKFTFSVNKPPNIFDFMATTGRFLTFVLDGAKTRTKRLMMWPFACLVNQIVFRCAHVGIIANIYMSLFTVHVSFLILCKCIHRISILCASVDYTCWPRFQCGLWTTDWGWLLQWDIQVGTIVLPCATTDPMYAHCKAQRACVVFTKCICIRAGVGTQRSISRM